MSATLINPHANLPRRSIGEYAIRALICLGVVSILLLLGKRNYDFVRYLVEAVSYPFGLDYGEGIVWQQAILIPSERMYGNIDQYPYIVFHYPPLYHLVVRLVHRLVGLPYLQSGRLVSAVSALLTSALVGALSYRVARVALLGRIASLVGAVIAALVPATFMPEIAWAPLFRVDMLAGALTFAGLLLAERSIRNPGLMFGAVAAFVAAVYTKQTEIIAPVAAMAALAIINRRTAITAVVGGLTVAVAGLIVLELKTNGRFLLHIFTYNENASFRAENMVNIFRFQEAQVIYLGLAFLGVYLAWRIWIIQTRKPDILFSLRYLCHPSGAVSLMMSVYFCLATIMLLTTTKDGSSFNYLLNWMNAGAVFIGFAVSYGLSRAFDPATADYPFVLLLLVALGGQIKVLQDAPQIFGDRVSQLARLTELVRQAQKPVLSDDMVLLMKAGKQIPIEPAIFQELITSGLWDERRELDMVRSNAFAFVIQNPYDLENRLLYTPTVANAIRSAYPVAVEVGGNLVRFPVDEPNPFIRDAH
jgi:hypothetical protein